MRVVVTGGAGFLGSHLCDALVARGDSVLCLDNLSTGRLSNMDQLMGKPNFSFVAHDACEPLPVEGPVEAVMHLASPASPPAYQDLSIETLRVGSQGTENALRLATKRGARFILASTSEVYGDPFVHPQVEDYWGNVNPIGPRSMYDEAKRYAEALTMAYATKKDTNVGIARIFNTYGPRMAAGDGRMVSNFIVQALSNLPITVYGDGEQTRSLCYVSDMVDGLIKLLDSTFTHPVNLGNPEEYTVGYLGIVISMLAGAEPKAFKHLPEQMDDPQRRRPDITRAKELLGWSPVMQLGPGLYDTIRHFNAHLWEVREAARMFDAD